MNKKNALTLILFVVLTVAGGNLVGYLSIPGAWYEGLQKPWFNPPNWIFGPVWTVLYMLMGIAGARVFIRERRRQLAKLWFLQLALNYAWSPAFFLMQRPGLSLIVLLGMLVTICSSSPWPGTAIVPRRCCSCPMRLWVSFAGSSTAAIWWLN
jgi:benzodiazapine receptor